MSVECLVGDETELPGGPGGCTSERHRSVEDLRLEECLHQLVVRAVPKRLCLVADGSGIFGGIAWALLGETQGQLEKVVLTQRNQMRAVLLTVERYSELEHNGA